MITHEQARKELRWVDVVSSNNLLSNYISQQEKKDELLGLYMVNYKPTFEDVVDLEIEKLKKELEEMK